MCFFFHNGLSTMLNLPFDSTSFVNPCSLLPPPPIDTPEPEIHVLILWAERPPTIFVSLHLWRTELCHFAAKWDKNSAKGIWVEEENIALVLKRSMSNSPSDLLGWCTTYCAVFPSIFFPFSCLPLSSLIAIFRAVSSEGIDIYMCGSEWDALMLRG